METQEPANVLPWTEINFQGIVFKLYQHENKDGTSEHNQLAMGSSTSKSSNSCIGITQSSQNYLQVDLSNFSGKLTLTAKATNNTPVPESQKIHEIPTQQHEHQKEGEVTSPLMSSSLLRKNHVSFPPSPERNEYIFDNRSATDDDDDGSYYNKNDSNSNNYNYSSQRSRDLGGGDAINDQDEDEDESYLSSLLDEEDDPDMNVDGLKQSLHHDNIKDVKVEEEKLNEDEILALSSSSSPPQEILSRKSGTTTNKLNLQVDVMDDIHASTVTNMNDDYESASGTYSMVADSTTSSIAPHPQGQQQEQQEQQEQQQDPERPQPQSPQTHPQERTLLHDVCNGLPTQTELQELLLLDPSACSKIDPQHGKLPLHILSENIELLKTLEGQQIVTDVAMQMIHIHPKAIITPDFHGRIPFIFLVQDWVEETYKKKKAKSKLQNILWKVRINQMFSPSVSGGQPTSTAAALGAAPLTDDAIAPNISTRLGRPSRISLFAARQHLSEAAASSYGGGGSGIDSASSTPMGGGDQSDGGSTHSNQSTKSLKKRRLTSTFGHVLRKTPSIAETPVSIIGSKAWNEQSCRKFPKAYLSELAQFGLHMLSAELDFWGGRSGRFLSYEHQRSNMQALGTQVAQVPQLLKTILLIEDDETRKRVLKYSIIRRIFLRKEIIEDTSWLLNMLQKKGLPSKRAVDFFEEASSFTLEEYVGKHRTPLQEDREAYQLERNDFARNISKLTGIVPTLFVLEGSEIERAAATSIVWQVMDCILSRPFVIGIIAIDLVLHVTLMISFRNAVTLNDGVGLFDAIPNDIVRQINIYFLVRKIAEALSLLQISRRVFTSYLSDIWNLIDFLAILLTVSANTYNTKHPDDFKPNLNAVVLAMLWIKVLNYMKAINVQMATFILSVMRIIFDIRFFAMVLAVIIMLFGDLFHIVFSTTNGGEFCSAEDGEELEANVVDFCNPSPGSSYLRMYALLIGDFELEQYQQNAVISAIFVVFTVFGVIILLNVLIAVVSDSYEKSTLSSHLLFGRARVTFLAEHIALEQFLAPGSNPFNEMLTNSGNMPISNKCILVIGLIFRWVVILMLIITALFADVYLVQRAIDAALTRDTSFIIMVLLVCLALLLTSALWIIIHFIVDGLSEHLTNKHVCLKKFADGLRYTANIQLRFIRYHLFYFDGSGKDDEEDVWRGRLDYLEKKMGRLVEQSEEQILLAIQSNEGLLKDEAILVEALRTELAALQSIRERI